MEAELGQFLFHAVNQHGVLQLTFVRRTVSRPLLRAKAKRRARGQGHLDQGSKQDH
jgi:hypothetical protein